VLQLRQRILARSKQPRHDNLVFGDTIVDRVRLVNEAAQFGNYLALICTDLRMLGDGIKRFQQTITIDLRLLYTVFCEGVVRDLSKIVFPPLEAGGN
jgi:hypothetical protein